MSVLWINQYHPQRVQTLHNVPGLLLSIPNVSKWSTTDAVLLQTRILCLSLCLTEVWRWCHHTNTLSWRNHHVCPQCIKGDPILQCSLENRLSEGNIIYFEHLHMNFYKGDPSSFENLCNARLCYDVEHLERNGKELQQMHQCQRTSKIESTNWHCQNCKPVSGTPMNHNYWPSYSYVCNLKSHKNMNLM